MSNAWKFWGKLESGERVYCRESGEVGIERDYLHIVEPAPAELYEIFKMWPGLVDEAIQRNKTFPIENTIDTAALKDTIIDLEFEAAENQNLIRALKSANDERDGMIASLMEDNAKLKGRIETLHETNRKWKEEVFRRDGTIDSLASEIRAGKYVKSE